MNTYVDTAAILAVLNDNDRFHAEALRIWDEILSGDQVLFTSNYVLVETTALLQHRFGVEAVRLFQNNVIPVIEVIWVDEAMHNQAISALLIAGRRELSLVDCTSFEIIRKHNIETIFTFDPHFSEQGFSVIPERRSP